MPHALGKNVGETEDMNVSPEPVLIEVVAPDASAASQILRSYIDDVASRYYGRQATDEEIDASLREDPSIDLALPSGVFLVARKGEVLLGCAGLRMLPERVGEVKRLFVAPAARGIGLGARLMGELERIARGHGVSVLRLDTRHDLVEARRLVCNPRLPGGACLQRRPVRRALVGKAAGLVAAGAKATPRMPIRLRRRRVRWPRAAEHRLSFLCWDGANSRTYR